MTDLTERDDALIALTADIVSAHVSNNSVDSDGVVTLIGAVHGALAGLGTPAPEPRRDPAVPVRSSVHPDYLVCLEDGRKLKMLRRYLKVTYGLTPDEYRRKWHLPHDYPMVAPNYAERRSALAKRIGLGTRPRREEA